jgi:hypothetical protein
MEEFVASFVLLISNSDIKRTVEEMHKAILSRFKEEALMSSYEQSLKE